MNWDAASWNKAGGWHKIDARQTRAPRDDLPYQEKSGKGWNKGNKGKDPHTQPQPIGGKGNVPRDAAIIPATVKDATAALIASREDQTPFTIQPMLEGVGNQKEPHVWVRLPPNSPG